MTHLIRSPRSGNEWSTHELEAFNIVIRDATITTFFANQELPLSPFFDTVLWNDRDGPADLGEVSLLEAEFYFYMKSVEEAESLESAVDDLASSLLRLLGFADKYRHVRQRPAMHFFMSGQRVDATADITLMNRKYFLLLGDCSMNNPEAQLIAKAIAAFHHNRQRRQRVGLPAPERQVIPAITMVGTAPIFYRIMITDKLLRAIESGTYPEEETVVFKFVPPVPDKEMYLHDGIRCLENRRIVLQCFEAFKTLIDE